MNTVKALLEKINTAPDSIEFAEVMEVIGDNYRFNPTAFSCGDAFNESGSNEGSCKILAFAQIHHLPEQQTLALFGRFYREDVLQHPQGTDHANIRNFMTSGWAGVSFESQPLTDESA